MSFSPAPALIALAQAVTDPCTGLTLNAVGAELSWQERGQGHSQGQSVLRVVLPYPPGPGHALGERLLELLQERPEWQSATLELTMAIGSSAHQQNLQPVQGIKNIIMVASGKGGVGKSTTAANLALALAHEGAQVGLLDADIYGPSQARMMGLDGQRPVVSADGRSFLPLDAHGVKVMSIGLLVDDEQPMVWRGPMVTQALMQLLNDCRWGQLDYLIVDMPPGTGDIQLTLSQRVPVSGAVIVTTPQDIALLDARKALKMFEKVNVPVLGIIENMSTHVCSNCGHEEHVFGAGGGARMSEQYGVDLLASLPLDIRIRAQADEGVPTVVAEPDGKLGLAYRVAACRTVARLARHNAQAGHAMPSIEIEHS